MANDTVIDAVNQVQVAIRSLRKFYTNAGRNDITRTIPAGDPGDAESMAKAMEAVISAMQAAEVTEDTIENIMAITMDCSEGAYYTKDIVQNTTLLGKFVNAEGNYKSIDNYIRIYYEPTVAANDPPLAEIDFYKTSETSGIEFFSVQGMTMEVVGSGASTQMSEFQVNADPNNPDRWDSPCLSAYVFPNHKIGPAKRDAAATALFLSNIPSVELSRCVPYIKIDFVSALGPSLSPDTKGISIVNFLSLDGTHSLDNNVYTRDQDKSRIGEARPMDLKFPVGTEYLNIISATASAAKDFDYSLALNAAGMELFTSPQTLINANINKEATGGHILDPMLPLASLTNLQIRVSGLNNDIFANEEGSLEFVVHDRSRMQDLGSLLSVDLFGSTYMTIEYGWSHPDGLDPARNPYGALLNSLRSTGTYNIVATDFSISNDGQANCSVRFTNRGGIEASIYPVATGDIMPVSPLKSLLMEYIAGITSAATDGQTDTSKITEIRGQINLAGDNASSPSSFVTREVFKSVVQATKPQQGGEPGSAEAIDKAIETLIGVYDAGTESFKGGDVATTSTSLAQATKDRSTWIISSYGDINVELDELGSIDPWKLNDYPYISGAQPKTAYVSLGYVMMNMVGKPLAATGQFDEVQMMFYRFNDLAGAAATYESTANFLFEKTQIQSAITEFVNKNPAMSIRSFIGMLNEFIGSSQDQNYGLRAQKTTLGDMEDVEGETDKANQQKEISALNNEMQKILSGIYKTLSGSRKIELRMPKMAIQFESLPVIIPGVGDVPTKIDRTRSILKVHIFDQNASPHESELFMLSAANSKKVTEKIKSEFI